MDSDSVHLYAQLGVTFIGFKRLTFIFSSKELQVIVNIVTDKYNEQFPTAIERLTTNIF